MSNTRWFLVLRQKREVRISISVAILLALFFCIKFAGPLAVRPLYESGRTGLLNVLTCSDRVQPLDEYMIRMEERVFGPASSVVSGLAMVLLTGAFLKNLGMSAYVLAVFLFLLATKFEVLFFPPYGDSAVGPFAEAIWLLRNNFDYAGLARQPIFAHGGPRVYLFSIYPGYLALLMRFFPHVRTFLAVNHLLVFAYCGILIAFFREALFQLMSRDRATLLSLLLLFLPLFQSQAEAVNMEIPTLMFSMISIYYLICRDMRKASLYAVCASLVKAYAVYVCLTVFVAGVLTVFLDKTCRDRKRTLFWSVAAGGFFAAKFLVSMGFFQIEGKIRFVGFLEGWPVIRTMGLSFVYIFSLAIFAARLLVQMRRDPGSRLSGIFQRYYAEIIFFLCCGMWFGLFLNSQAVFYRYQLHLAPFLLGCVFIVCSFFVRRERAFRRGIVVCILLASLFSYGMNHAVDGGGASEFERSLEYRRDLKVHMEVARLAEQKYSTFTIAAPFLIAQILALPELGYVSRPLDVMIYGFPCTYGGIKNFPGLDRMLLSQTVWIAGVDNRLGDSKSLIGPRDRVVDEVYAGSHSWFFFLGGFRIERFRALAAEMSRRAKLRALDDGKQNIAQEQVLK